MAATYGQIKMGQIFRATVEWSRGVTTIGAAGARHRAHDLQGPTETIKLIY